MKLIFSLSNQTTKLAKLELPRLLDENNKNPGVQTIATNSVQVSWQFQVLPLTGREWEPYNNGSWVVMAVEAYSRYTLIKPYAWKPQWQDIESDFKALWLEHMLYWFQMGGFVRSAKHEQQVKQYFSQLPSAECYRNLDRSIGGTITDCQLWLAAYFRDVRPKYFGDKEAWDLSQHLNQQTRKIKMPNGKKQKFLPHERFLDESLYRFASGICDMPIPGCKKGDFPNPYKERVELSVLKK